MKKVVEWFVVFIIFLAMSVVCYTQSIGMKITERVNFDESGRVNYRVHLTDSTYYNTNYLDEGMQYITSIIDYIDINFNYLVKFDDFINYKLNTKAIANVKIVDKENSDNVIYSTTDTLLSPSSSKETDTDAININESLRLDYKKYNKLANDFKSNYGISANCVLMVSLSLDYSGEYKSIENISNNRLLSLQIPLSEQMITIDKTDDITNNSSYTSKTNNTIYNKLLFVLSIFFMIISIVSLIKIIKNYRKVKKEETPYQKELRKILRQYDAYITESKEENINLNDKTIIKISTFKELLDVRNNVEKTIIYNKVNSHKSRFMIIEDDQLYCYEMNEEDYN